MTAADRRRGIMVPIAATILGLAAIGVVEDIPVRHSIEHKLTTASNAALAKAGVTVEGVSFTGRDGTVRVDTVSDGDRAKAVVSNVNGVRVVRVVLMTSSTQPPIPAPTPSVSLTAVPSAPPSAPAPSAPTASGAPSAPAPSVASSAPAPSASPSAPAAPSPSPTTAPTTGSPAQVQAQLNALGEITFASGSSALTSRDKVIVARVAQILAANPTIAIHVQGDTDSIGSAASNLTMSRSRAQTVANALHALGIATSRMTIVAYGETKPLVPNDSAVHRGINRRVDFSATED